MKRTLLIVCCCLLLFAGCKEKLTTITLSEEHVFARVGDTISPTFETNLKSNDGRKFNWTSEKENVVSVSEEGVVTALTAGESIITITGENDVTDTITVTVVADICPMEPEAERTLCIDKYNSYTQAKAYLNNNQITEAKAVFKQLGDFSDSQTQYTNTVAQYPAVGDAYQGGIIFYILKSGDIGFDASIPHGLISSTEDQSLGVPWSTQAKMFDFIPGTQTSVGTGKINTDLIIAKIGKTTNYAAGIARAYRGGGYSDWFLPSLDELNELYKNQSVVGVFDVDAYWSS